MSFDRQLRKLTEAFISNNFEESPKEYPEPVSRETHSVNVPESEDEAHNYVYQAKALLDAAEQYYDKVMDHYELQIFANKAAYAIEELQAVIEDEDRKGAY